MSYNLIPNIFSEFYKQKITTDDIKSENEEGKTTAFTFRMPNDLKNYYEKMASSCRMTLQSTVIQILCILMDQHIQHNNATILSRSLANRFLKIFTIHDIAIYNICKILKDFNVTNEMLQSDSKICELLTDEIIAFLCDAFNLRKEWVLHGVNSSHISYHCYKNIAPWFSLMQQTQNSITLALIFDEKILQNPATDSKDFIESRYVQAILFVETELNGIKYNKPYIAKYLDWDYDKCKNHIYALIEGMNITAEYAERNIQKYFGKLSIDNQNGNLAYILNALKKHPSTIDPVVGNITEGSLDDFVKVKQLFNRLESSKKNILIPMVIV